MCSFECGLLEYQCLVLLIILLAITRLGGNFNDFTLTSVNILECFIFSIYVPFAY